ITHDLEEAIRIGDRIAIMKEGRIVQIGTPEEIVLQPKDRYVADFVEGISRLNLVKAHSIMTEARGDCFVDGQPIESLPSADIDADLQTMIDFALSQKADTITIRAAGKLVGIVTREGLLRAVRGEEEADGR